MRSRSVGFASAETNVMDARGNDDGGGPDSHGLNVQFRASSPASTIASSASAFVRSEAEAAKRRRRERELDVEEDDEEGVAGDDGEKNSQAATSTTNLVVFPREEDIVVSTLKKLTGYGKGKNPTYSCFVKGCTLGLARGHGNKRLESHVEKHIEVSKEIDIKICWSKMLLLHRGTPWNTETRDAVTLTRPQGGGKKTMAEYYVKLPGRDAPALHRPLVDDEKTMAKYDINDLKAEIADATARMVLELGLPLSIIDSSAYRELVEFTLAAGRHTAIQKMQEVSSNDVLVKRRTIGTACDTAADLSWKELAGPVAEEGALSGLTLVQDGRSNFRADPMITSGIQGRVSFAPTGTVNAGNRKKDAEYILELCERHLDDDDLGLGFGKHIYGWTLDGIQANINAMRRAWEVHSLLVCRCQAHGVSLVLKRIFTRIFGSMIKDADTVISYIRQHQRVNSILKSVSKTVLFPFIETRFDSHAVALRRLLDAKNALTVGLINSTEFILYEKESTAKAKDDLIAVKAILTKPDFWLQVEYSVEITLPISIALRMMDRSDVRAVHAYEIWRRLESQLRETLTSEKLVNFEIAHRLEIYRIFTDEWRKSHYPVLGAAYFLNPANLDRLRAIKLEVDLGQATLHDEAEYKILYESAKACVEKVIRRRFRESPSNVVDQKVENVLTDLGHYIFGEGGEFLPSYPSENPLSYWGRQNGVLSVVARTIMWISVTTSSVERLHKIYSLIHCPKRNRLNESSVDRYALANLALRAKRCKPKLAIKDFNKWFTLEVSVSTLNDLERWSKLIRVADLQTIRTIGEGETANGGMVAGNAEDLDLDAETFSADAGLEAIAARVKPEDLLSVEDADIEPFMAGFDKIVTALQASLRNIVESSLSSHAPERNTSE